VTDPAGNIVVVGSYGEDTDFGGGLRTAHGSGDIVVLGLGPDGSYRWDAVFGGSSTDAATALAIDEEGKLVVTGHSSGSIDFGGGVRGALGERSLFVLGLGPNGSYRWDKTIGNFGVNEAHSVAADTRGNVYVTGVFQNTVDFGGGPRTWIGRRDAFVVSLTSDGTYRWDRTDGAVDTIREPTGIAVDANGKVVVAGVLGADRIAWALDTNGGHLWDMSAVGRVDPSGVSIDVSGNVLISGNFLESVDFGGGLRTATLSDAFVLGLSANGAYRWDRTAVGASRANGYAVATDAQ